MKGTVTLAVAAIVVALGAGAALAHGGRPTVSTTTVQGQTQGGITGFDCEGNQGVESHTFNGVLHVTEFDDGHRVTTLTQAGTWSLDLAAPLPDYAGRFVIRETHTLSGEVDSFTISAPFIARGSDGSQFVAIFTLQFVFVDGEAVLERVMFACPPG